MAAGMDKALTVIARGGISFMALAAVPSLCLYDVDGGQRAVVLNMFTGVDEKVRGEGTHFRIPWVQQPKL